MEVTLKGQSLNDEPLIFPKFTVQITSPFQREQKENGFLLKVKEDPKAFASKDIIGATGWMAAWLQPEAPWKNRFPESVNNTLIVRRPSKLIIDSMWIHDAIWIRDVRIKNAAEAPIYIKETWSSPQQDEVSSWGTTQEAVISLADQPPVKAKVKNSSWIYTLKSGEPFERGTVRIATLLRDQLTMYRVTVPEAQKIIANQKAESIRIDAWIPPGSPPVKFNFQSKQKVEYAFADDPVFRRTKTGLFDMEAGETWRHAIILVKPTEGDYGGNKGAQILGDVYW